MAAEGFAWDSPVLPGIGPGNHAGRAFRRGDRVVIDGVLAEFPVAGWRGPGIPFTHSCRRSMGRPVGSPLERVASLPALPVHDMHMADLVRDGRIRESPLPPRLKAAHAPARRRRCGSGDPAAPGERLRTRGCERSTLSRRRERPAGAGR